MSRRLRLLKVILKKYRDIRRMCDEEIMERYRMSCDYYESFEWFARMMEGKDPDMATERLIHTSHVTEGIILQIEEAVREYEASSVVEGRRKCEILKARYFDRDKKSVGQLAERYGVSRITILRDTRMAAYEVSAIMFGEGSE